MTTFFVRLGDVSSALSVWLATVLLHAGSGRLATLNLGLGGARLFIALVIGRRCAVLAARS